MCVFCCGTTFGLQRCACCVNLFSYNLMLSSISNNLNASDVNCGCMLSHRLYEYDQCLRGYFISWPTNVYWLEPNNVKPATARSRQLLLLTLCWNLHLPKYSTWPTKCAVISIFHTIECIFCPIRELLGRAITMMHLCMMVCFDGYVTLLRSVKTPILGPI